MVEIFLLVKVISLALQNLLFINPSAMAASNFPFELLGSVTEGAIWIDEENWDTISDWQNKYDHAIGNLLAAQESEQALTAL
jgi:hypothetical protein